VAHARKANYAACVRRILPRRGRVPGSRERAVSDICSPDRAFIVEPVSRAAEAFGFSRPSFYAAQAALDEGGLAALVPARPGPKRAHKMTREVVAFAREQRAADPKLSSHALVELIEERFGVRVHRRSVERALARAERAARQDHDQESEGD
jgi:Homeodomain-like domain